MEHRRLRLYTQRKKIKTYLQRRLKRCPEYGAASTASDNLFNGFRPFIPTFCVSTLCRRQRCGTCGTHHRRPNKPHWRLRAQRCRTATWRRSHETHRTRGHCDHTSPHSHFVFVLLEIVIVHVARRCQMELRTLLVEVLVTLDADDETRG